MGYRIVHDNNPDSGDYAAAAAANNKAELERVKDVLRAMIGELPRGKRMELRKLLDPPPPPPGSGKTFSEMLKDRYEQLMDNERVPGVKKP